MKYSRMPLPQLIEFFISQGREGEFWDFKQEWHKNIQDLMKDIICFANTVHDENCFLIFGIGDDLSLTGMNEARKKQADVLDALSKLDFAGDNKPKISVETINYQGVEVDVLTVYDTISTPIYLRKTYGKMKQGCIYARVGDRNTPDDGNADIGVIENLWRKRFGLTKTPLEIIFDALGNKSEWQVTENGYYNIFKPEYTIERMDEDVIDIGRGSDEFYSYTQTNESTSYYMMDIKAKGTSLESYQIVVLDSGRLSIPVPEWGYISLDQYRRDVIRYKYYINGSHTEQLMQFMYDPQNSDERWAFEKFEEVILFFDSENEKNSFEEYVKCNKVDLKNRIDGSDEYDYIVTDNEEKTKEYKRSLHASIVLKEMLKEFRKFEEVLAT